MRSTRDRIRHAISFELGGLALVSPLGAWTLGLPAADITMVRIASAIIATVWTYVYNFAFDALMQRMAGGTQKSIQLRALHAVFFETGLLAMLTPMLAWYLGISLLHAFLVDVAFALFYVVYTFVFNWAYDRIFPLHTWHEASRPSQVLL
ncbi:PACE efflux transporter [Microvirga sp. VF16]|uniref:PACE efflux transporter n=1 Tax=Microvirga sp. VF16 TaxID=2807101 RepID=UPI00193E9BF0|nr:PACE efflux transporter [Microvirga sp. VF16]QRM35658.1 PACE efflux transporter [Microvirga sp. VF16]